MVHIVCDRQVGSYVARHTYEQEHANMEVGAHMHTNVSM